MMGMSRPSWIPSLTKGSLFFPRPQNDFYTRFK
jgi:hypothetical protein